MEILRQTDDQTTDVSALGAGTRVACRSVACKLLVKPFFHVRLSDGSSVLWGFYSVMNVPVTNLCSDANFINQDSGSTDMS